MSKNLLNGINLFCLTLSGVAAAAGTATKREPEDQAKRIADQLARAGNHRRFEFKAPITVLGHTLGHRSISSTEVARRLGANKPVKIEFSRLEPLGAYETVWNLKVDGVQTGTPMEVYRTGYGRSSGKVTVDSIPELQKTYHSTLYPFLKSKAARHTVSLKTFLGATGEQAGGGNAVNWQIIARP